MVTADRAHWDGAYAAGDTSRSWYQEHAAVSLSLIRAGGGPDRAVVDAGGGASPLAGDLLAAGYHDVTVLDLSAASADLVRGRLGPRSEDIRWEAADVLQWRPNRTYDVWHDRALLHFFTDRAEQAQYADTLRGATTPGSTVVIGVFGPDGPSRCSGLPVARYDAEKLMALLGSRFRLVRTLSETHLTPAGGGQEFTWVSAVRQS